MFIHLLCDTDVSALRMEARGGEHQHLILQVQYYAYNIVTPSLCVFGIICNLLSLMVLSELTRREYSRCPYIYLTALAVFDNAVLVLYILYTLVSMNHPDGHSSKLWRYYDTIVMTPVINIFTFSSAWMVVVVTIDRVLFFHSPESGSRGSTLSAKLKIISVFLLAVIFNIPRFFLFKVEYSRAEDRYVPISTAFRQSTAFYVITCLYVVFVHFVPLTIVFAGNIYLIRELLKSRVVCNPGSDTQLVTEVRATSEEKCLTVTLVAIMILYLVTLTPSAFSDRPLAYALYHGNLTWEEFPDDAPYRIAQTISNVLVIVNCSLNFLLYWGFNKKFVATLKKIYCDKFRLIQRVLHLRNDQNRNYELENTERERINETPT